MTSLSLLSPFGSANTTERLIAALRQMLALLWSWASPRRALAVSAPDTLRAIEVSRKSRGRSARNGLNVDLVIVPRWRTAPVHRTAYISARVIDTITKWRSSPTKLMFGMEIQSKDPNNQDGQHTPAFAARGGHASTEVMRHGIHPVREQGYHVLHRGKLAIWGHRRYELRRKFTIFRNPQARLLKDKGFLSAFADYLEVQLQRRQRRSLALEGLAAAQARPDRSPGLAGFEFGDLNRTTFKWAIGACIAFPCAAITSGAFPLVAG
ncbi:hypothetical protein OKA06_01440 [Novosphingobium sp. MW5]|nr:hypothetical protein [Novosphingobium sp. MW5]